MKYVLTIYIYGRPVHSKPLTQEELKRTIDVNIANGIGNFEVSSVKED